MNTILKSVAYTLVLALFLSTQNLTAQPNDRVFSVLFQPVFSAQKIVLNEAVFAANGDSMSVQTLKFYIGNFEFLKGGRVVFTEKKYHLLDLEEEQSLLVGINMPDLPFDSLRFDLGVDSSTQASGAMGGDLDPTRGMFWTWQSGYIHFKIEGFSAKSHARKGAFEFHLGGYSSPFSAVQKICLPVASNEKMFVDVDLAPFFENVDWVKKPAVMSPGSEAARLSAVLAKSFRSHEN